MAGGQRRKCKCCRRLFRPDPRSRRHQRYCSEPPCSPAEPRARPQVRHAGSPSQRTRVTSATPGTSYGSAPGRSRHPGYWRKPRRCATALQDVSRAQSIDSEAKTANFVRSPLQDLITAQPAVLIGLIAHLVGTPLQDDIVRTTDRLLRLGQDILAMSQGPAAAPALTARRPGRDRLRDVRQDPRLPGSSGPDHHPNCSHARS